MSTQFHFTNQSKYNQIFVSKKISKLKIFTNFFNSLSRISKLSHNQIKMLRKFSSLLNLSPLDGRYRSMLDKLPELMSESGLIRNRIRVEIS